MAVNDHHTKRLKRTLLVCFSCVLLGSAQLAQAQGTTLYRATVLEMNEGQSPKPMMGALHQAFQASNMQHDRSARTLDLECAASITVEAMRELVEANGFFLLGFERMGAEGPERLDAGDAFPFPVQWNTGDPDLDQQRYDEQKALWIARNPEAYELMLSGENNAKTTHER
ncbi:MAG: hypothetical protein R2815_14150 [Flavobacteriales bacterium]